MSDGFQFFDIILIALIAIFIILRLRAVLGRRTGNERQRPDIFNRESGPAQGKAEERGRVVRMPPRAGGDERGPPRPASEGEHEHQAEPAMVTAPNLRVGLTQIRVADPEFDPRGFVEGARAAFAMIVDAFAKGDTAALRPLLGDDVYDSFAGVIRERLAAKRTQETKLVAVDTAEMIEAGMEGRTARVTMKFVSEQVLCTRDEAGNVVEGDPEKTVRVTDIWTFARNTRARDPNWALVETRAPQ